MVGYSISITGCIMYIIQVDGGSEVSNGHSATSIGILYPGERVDIIVERTPRFDKSNAAISIEFDAEYGSVGENVRETILISL
jgi:hypothetical protein